MAQDDIDPAVKAEAHSVFVRLVLPPYTVHFKSPTYMKEATLELLDTRVCKEALKASATNPDVREAIGRDEKFWTELVLLLRAATTSLERRSFSIWDPTSVDYESTSGALIASHYPSLWKDLERLNNLVSIARNVLTAGQYVQDLAAEFRVEAEIFKLINCAVRVTARGYDGEAGTGDEEKWQYIVNNYKKVLITSLQFLNNLLAQNERRKLMLWIHLFETTPDAIFAARETSTATSGPEPERMEENIQPEDLLLAYGHNQYEELDLEDAQELFPRYEKEQWIIEDEDDEIHNEYVYFSKLSMEAAQEEAMLVHGRHMTDAELYLDLPRRWALLGEAGQKRWKDRWQVAERIYFENQQAVFDWDTRTRERAAGRRVVDDTKERLQLLEMSLSQRYRDELAQSTQSELPLYRASPLRWKEDPNAPDAIMTDDMQMLFTAEAGTKILESGKAELMKRLEGYEQPHEAEQAQVEEISQPTEAPSIPESRPVEQQDEAWSLRSDDGQLDEQEGSEEAEDDYPGSTEDGRGLLTDVPLILGPSEIEVLPMIVMSAIVPSAELLFKLKTNEERHEVINMCTVRCHLLFAHDNGRNLLRELLIFVAAWDLREEELYFKFMVKIMEAILTNGLMPYAYHAFRDRSRSKDIISPAQAVIMKLLTNIFRARSESHKAVTDKDARKAIEQMNANPPKVDVHILNFVFTEFRQHIIPQTCALIFLQGQIHQGRASPEDFPLNLWDMERMYEGVYQYLEFFAVLTEEGFWKNVLAGWEISSELVTLLRELEGGIPKMQVIVERVPRSSVPEGTRINNLPRSQRASSADARLTTPAQVDSLAPPALPPQIADPPPALPSQTAGQQPQTFGDVQSLPHQSKGLPPTKLPPAAGQQPLFEAETPLAYPEEPHDEPSNFEWRNLKKLTVLVLSSLIWKCRLVQDQVAEYGGLEALVSCCKDDDHNPYIREHAIMCLRFAVEDHPRNAAVIRKMAAEGEKRRAQLQAEVGPNADLTDYDMGIDDVPREVLDANGYETFMDGKGQIGLRRKEPVNQTLPSVGTLASSSSSRPMLPPMQAGMAKLTPERAAELMQNALKELPLGMGMSFAKGLEGLMKDDQQ